MLSLKYDEFFLHPNKNFNVTIVFMEINENRMTPHPVII